MMKSKAMMKAARVEYWWGQKFLQSCSPEIWSHRSTRPRRQKSWNGVWICGCSGGLLRAFGVHENGGSTSEQGFQSTKLTHNSGRVTQICVFNTVKLGTSASSP